MEKEQQFIGANTVVNTSVKNIFGRNHQGYQILEVHPQKTDYSWKNDASLEDIPVHLISIIGLLNEKRKRKNEKLLWISFFAPHPSVRDME